MIFDQYIIVDWSASNRPRVGKDSVWICVLGADGQLSTDNPPTRGKAEVIVRDALRHFVADGERVLVGFDFPYGYPAGFAAALGLTGPRLLLAAACCGLTSVDIGSPVWLPSRFRHSPGGPQRACPEREVASGASLLLTPGVP